MFFLKFKAHQSCEEQEIYNPCHLTGMKHKLLSKAAEILIYNKLVNGQP